MEVGSVETALPEKQLELPVAEVENAEDDNDEPDAPGEPSAAKKKKKKKKKKAGAAAVPSDFVNPYRVLNYTGPRFPKGQSSPEPQVPIHSIFSNGAYPTGELLSPREDQAWRLQSPEAKSREDIFQARLLDARRAAEVHRHVRRAVQGFARPGIKLFDMCERLEDLTRKLVKADGLKAGIAFPTGCSLNHVAAHYTPNAGDNTTLSFGDVMKVDFGVHVNGTIIDCAFTVAFDPKFDALLQAVQAATNTGIRSAGIDARLSEIGANIQETMESYEIELDGRMYTVHPVQNLNGHSIAPYVIHGGKSVPIVKGTPEHYKMEESEFFAIETFGSVRGKAYVREDLECSHYGLVPGARDSGLRLQSTKELFKTIQKNFGTLAFCRRYLDRLGVEKYAMGLKQMVDAGVVTAYPPLVDVTKSYVAQWEHTLAIRPSGYVEVLSRGEDY